MADLARTAWVGIDVLHTGDADRARSSWMGIEVLSPLEDQARAAWSGIDVLMTGDVNRARTSWMGIEVLMDASDPPIEGVDLLVELAVFELQEERPLTGQFSEATTIGGWLWDRRRLEDSRWNYAQYLTALGGHSIGLKDGTKNSWWQSGTILGCEYLYTDYQFVQDRRMWTPLVANGEYALQFDNRLLYSDYSNTAAFHTEILHTSVMKHELHSDAVWSSIQVALWRRDDVFTIRKHWDFKYVDGEFSGELDESSSSRLDTTDGSGTIIVDNLASRKYEYMIQDGRVLLNGVHSIETLFTRSPSFPISPPPDNTENFIEAGGFGQEDGRAVLLKYLPVQPGSVRVWVDTDGIELNEWTRVDDLGFAEPADAVFQVDTDLGIITMGGFQAPDLILQGNLNAFDSEVTFYPEQIAIDDYPPRGVIIIDSEEIAYLERTNKRFSNCIRGYNGTTAVAHTNGASIQHRRMGAGTLGEIYVEYIAVPRIDYEVTAYITRTANTPRSYLDVKPLSNVETTNIVQIHPGDISLDSILLETDSPLIGGNLYGPVFYGSDVSRMTATGYDPHGNPIPDIELTISIIEGSGFLNGVLNEFTDLTNTLGEIYADYNHPMVRDEFEFSVSSIVHDSGDTIMTVPELVEGTDLNDIWIFQVLKFDKLVGTVGLPLEITATGAAVDPYGTRYLDLDGIISEDFRDGLVHVTVSGVKYYRTITWLEYLFDVDDQLYTRIYVDVLIPGSLVGQTAYLLEPQAIEWNPLLLNGTRYILYEWSDDVLHPLTGQLGAFYPVHPDSINTDTGEIAFLDRLLPIPDPDDDEDNLGAYVVVAPGQTTLQASGRDPLTGLLVQSNIIRLNLELPNFFVGVDSTGTLPVPTGWRFPSEENNIGGGLGGANFITINPAASGINQFALQIEL